MTNPARTRLIFIAGRIYADAVWVTTNLAWSSASACNSAPHIPHTRAADADLALARPPFPARSLLGRSSARSRPRKHNQVNRTIQQLVMLPSSVMPIMASSDDLTMAARRACASSAARRTVMPRTTASTIGLARCLSGFGVIVDRRERGDVIDRSRWDSQNAMWWLITLTVLCCGPPGLR
jgi:hypothetical protein